VDAVAFCFRSKEFLITLLMIYLKLNKYSFLFQTLDFLYLPIAFWFRSLSASGRLFSHVSSVHLLYLKIHFQSQNGFFGDPGPKNDFFGTKIRCAKIQNVVQISNFFSLFLFLLKMRRFHCTVFSFHGLSFFKNTVTKFYW